MFLLSLFCERMSFEKKKNLFDPHPVSLREELGLFCQRYKFSSEIKLLLQKKIQIFQRQLNWGFCCVHMTYFDARRLFFVNPQVYSGSLGSVRVCFPSDITKFCSNSWTRQLDSPVRVREERIPLNVGDLLSIFEI